MYSFPFDPDANKVTNTYGGFDSNQKGLFQYPRWKTEKTRPPPVSCSLHPNFYTITGENNKVDHSGMFDSVTKRYRIFTTDPDLDKKEDAEKVNPPEEPRRKETDHQLCMPCSELVPRTIRSPPLPSLQVGLEPLRKPIDPIHWKPNLFDTRFEKYYLRNVLMEDPYREFLTSCAKAVEKPHYFTEYKERYSGNPTMESSSPGRILGLGRPTDIPGLCDWKRNKTNKLRDAVFSQEKDPIDSHLDYNDPKRYNPWPRLRMSYDVMVENNFRPRPLSGVDYSVATLLPAVSTHSKLWAL